MGDCLACEKAIEILSAEHLQRGMSAYVLCTLAHFLTLAGTQGRLKEFALPPGNIDGNYKKKSLALQPIDDIEKLIKGCEVLRASHALRKLDAGRHGQ